MGDMEQPKTLIGIAAQGAVIGIISVGSNQNIAWCRRTSDRYDDGRVLKDDPVEGNLDDIAKFGFG